jgi:hypothetical protein
LDNVYHVVTKVSGFSKRIEVRLSFYNVGGESSARGTNRGSGGEPDRGVTPSLEGGSFPPQNFEILGDALRTF